MRGSSHDDQYGDGDGVGDDHHDVEEVESISTATAWELISCGAGHTARATHIPAQISAQSDSFQYSSSILVFLKKFHFCKKVVVYRGRPHGQGHSHLSPDFFIPIPIILPNLCCQTNTLFLPKGFVYRGTRDTSILGNLTNFHFCPNCLLSQGQIHSSDPVSSPVFLEFSQLFFFVKRV